MASEREQVLVNVFWAVAGEGWRGVLANLLGLPIGEDTEADATTVKSGSSASTSATGESSTWSKVADYASFGVAPLARAIFGVFTGGDKEPAPLVKFALPASVTFETAVRGGSGLEGVDYDQYGMPRVTEGARARGGERAILGRGENVSVRASEPGGEGAAMGRDAAATRRIGDSVDVVMNGFAEEGGQRSSAAAPQVTIQVQAMDSRSFLDHSAEIARAVREAMLNMHALNDVVSEL